MRITVLALVLLAACATQFSGEPTVPGGPRGCAAMCERWQMDLVGMIAMGEYSDGCICQVRGLAPPQVAPPPPPPPAVAPAVSMAAAALPAVVGVVMQMRRQAAAQHQQQQQQGR